MTTARSRAASAWGVTPVVVGHAEPDAVGRPAHDDVAPDPTPPFGVAWAEYDRLTADEFRAHVEQRRTWAEDLSGGIVTYPHDVERPWVRKVDQDDAPTD